MKKAELAMMMSSISSTFSNMKLPDTFSAPPGTSNEAAAHLHDLHLAMTELLVASTLASTATKRHNQAKEHIDELTQEDGEARIIPNDTQAIICEDNEFVFTKKRIKGSKEIKVKDLLIELAKNGVSNDVIQKSVASAEKSRPGNLYYIVEKLGE